MPLLEMKQKVQILAEKTAQELKKNVYKNYTQFIETAREISSMYYKLFSMKNRGGPIQIMLHNFAVSPD